MPEGGVSGESPGQDFSCGCEFLADESKAEEPGPHGVFRILVLLGLGACGSDFLCHLAECKAKLNVGFQLSGVKAVPLAVCRGIELEKSELNRSFGEGCVEVQHMVAAAVVMVVSAVVFPLAVVPNVCQLCHRLRFLPVDLSEEIFIDWPAVASNPVMVKGKALGQEAFVACHDVGKVSQGLRCVPLRSDVDVYFMHCFP